MTIRRGPFVPGLLAVPALFALAPARAQEAADLAAKLDAIEKAVDAKREELHIPGVSLVIVRGDEVLYKKGLGLRDVEKKLPVTPETLFAIGSSSKAFAAMTVLMSQDDGKLSLTDSPKKYLPYFKLKDPDADAKITVGDLLSHRSGLARTELLWATGRLKTQEVVRALADVKPTAKFGETWQYQNVMYAVAGEVVAKVEKRPWRDVVTRRLFRPLGMKASNLSVRDTTRAKDHSKGYAYEEDKKEYRLLPMRDISVIAPAGGINSNASDMGQWLRFLVNGGAVGGRRLVSESAFAEALKPRMTIGGPVKYGLGWFLRSWNGHTVVEHGGNIDGFNAQVAFMPDQKIGLVLLTNVTASSLGTQAMDIVWQNLVGKPEPPKPGETAANPAVPPLADDPAALAGSYRDFDANLDVEIELKDGKLIGRPAGQEPAPLEKIGAFRYKVGPPAPDGFFVTFRRPKDDPAGLEGYVESPERNFTITRKKAATAPPKAVETDQAVLKELLGAYESLSPAVRMEVADRGGKVSLVVAGQPPYPLVARAGDEYTLGGLPAEAAAQFSVKVKRDAGGKVTGLDFKQPGIALDLKRVSADAGAKLPTAEEVRSRHIEAAGGEANLRRHKSVRQVLEINMEYEGVRGRVVQHARAPHFAASETELRAAGKVIARSRSVFDGQEGGSEGESGPSEAATGKAKADALASARSEWEPDWTKVYKSVKVVGLEKVNGEESYVVELAVEGGSTIKDFYSAKTYLHLRRDTQIEAAPGVFMTSSATFFDYKPVDGVMVPHRVVSTKPQSGDVEMILKEIKWDVPVSDKTFRLRRKPRKK